MIPKPQRDDRGKVQGEFYPLQKPELLALRKSKLINNAAFVHLALRYENPYCNRPITVVPKEFALRWQIPESSVYEAIAKLKESEAINIKAGKITVEWADSQQANDSENPESFWESRNISENPETVLTTQKKLRNPRKNSGSSEKQRSKPAQRKDSSPPKDIKNKKELINSLSDMPPDERESFEKFVRDEYRKSRGREIETTFAAFMKPEHFQEWYQKYQNRPEALKATQNTKWENHKERDEWLAEIESSGNPAMFAGSDKEKQAFIEWCWRTKQFSWLKEEGNDGI